MFFFFSVNATFLFQLNKTFRKQVQLTPGDNNTYLVHIWKWYGIICGICGSYTTLIWVIAPHIKSINTWWLPLVSKTLSTNKLLYLILKCLSIHIPSTNSLKLSIKNFGPPNCNNLIGNIIIMVQTNFHSLFYSCIILLHWTHYHKSPLFGDRFVVDACNLGCHFVGPLCDTI